jgi:hypothetical protein
MDTADKLCAEDLARMRRLRPEGAFHCEARIDDLGSSITTRSSVDFACAFADGALRVLATT